jgi:hypothetical protein
MFIVFEIVKFVELNICDICYFKTNFDKIQKTVAWIFQKIPKPGFEHFPQSKDRIPRRIQIWFHIGMFFCQSFGRSICSTCNLCVLQANTPCSRSCDGINCSVCVDLHLKWWWAVWNKSKYALCLILSIYSTVHLALENDLTQLL